MAGELFLKELALHRASRFLTEVSSASRRMIDGGAMDMTPQHRVELQSASTNSDVVPRRAELYPVLLLAALVFIVVFPWHAVNQRLPTWDAAQFVLTSQTIADAFDKGFVSGLKALYLERGWRPTIFPTLAAPFFVMSGGQIRLAVGLTLLAIALILALYVYAFFRQEYSTGRALTGSMIILGASWVINYSSLFYAELFWIAATAGVVHHLTTALRQSSRSQYVLAGVWFGLMAAARPVETVVIALVPVATFLAYTVRRGTAKAADVGMFAAQLLLAVIAVALLTRADHNTAVIVVLLLATLLIVVLRARRFLADSPILASLVSAELIALAWHLPTMRGLYLWAEATSFGILAQTTDTRFKGLSPVTILGQLMETYSPALLLTVVVLAAVAVIGIFRPARSATHSGVRALIGTAILMIAPMLVLYSWSGTSDPRRIMPGVLLLYMGVIAVALAPGGLIPRVRLMSLLGIAVALLAAATATGLDISSNTLTRVKNTFGSLRPVSVERDPNEPVLDSLLQLGISSGNVSAYTRCYRAYDQCERSKLPPFEPSALASLARERHVPLFIHYVLDLDFSTPESLSKQLIMRDFQYLLIDMADVAPFNQADPYAAHTEQFIAMEGTATFPPGLISRGCFSTLSRPICVVEVAR